jgi:hypothetical protein
VLKHVPREKRPYGPRRPSRDARSPRGLLRCALIALALLAACDKPADEDCRKALANMQHLLGTENLTEAKSLEGDVRACRAGSTKEAVACAIKAQTLDELNACDFHKVPAKPAGSGSAK